jgi:hypothetical protein
LESKLKLKLKKRSQVRVSIDEEARKKKHREAKTHHRLDMRLDPATTPMGQPPIRLDGLPHVFGDELLDDIDKDLFFLVGPSLVSYHGDKVKVRVGNSV